LGIHTYKGYLITGAVGVGKTLLANCILSYMKNILKYNAYSVQAGCLVSADAEETIKKLFQTLR
jgi:SpoVK/Ycf46/Vps4 family AAA+-type ATPase